MPFQPGISGNSNGKLKGTPNRVTRLQREFIQNLLDGQQHKIKRELSKLHGLPYLTIITKLLEFTVPRVTRQELEFPWDENRPKQVMIINGQEIEF